MDVKDSGVAKGGGDQVEAHALGRRPWGRNSTLFAVILNVFLIRNLDQSMLKNVYFLVKNCKNRLTSLPWRLGLHTDPCVVTPAYYYKFLVLNTFYSAQKRTK